MASAAPQHNSNAAPTTGSLFQANVIRNMRSDGVGLFNNFYADVKNNTITVPASDPFAGIDVQDFYGSGGALEQQGADAAGA